MSTPRMHLGLYTMPPTTHHSSGTWKHPFNISRGFEFDRQDVWQYVGQVAERAKFDFIFAADVAGIYSEYGGSYEAAVQYASQVPCFAAPITMTSIAAVTRNIGVIATQSIAGVAPYITARTFATLDHLTSGRAGWNVVTGHHKNAAENIGLADQIDHDDRYDIADEYVDVCLQLWESWDADAIVADPERDVYAEPSRVHAIDFSGKHFKSRGPLNVHRSPQGHPALAQAGSSARGIRTAARIADVLFSIQPFRDGMKRYRDRIRAVAVDEHGRDPDTIKVFHAFQPFVAETEEIAREKLEYHNSLVSPNAGLVVLSGHLGVDLSLEDPNRTFAGMEHVPGSRGVVDQYAKAEEGRDLTLSQIGQRVGQSVSTPQVYGTATQVADWLEETSNFIGGDGFIVSPAWLPGSLEDFADLVVPELQRRGLVRSDYRAKSTLRDNLNEF